MVWQKTCGGLALLLGTAACSQLAPPASPAQATSPTPATSEAVESQSRTQSSSPTADGPPGRGAQPSDAKPVGGQPASRAEPKRIPLSAQTARLPSGSDLPDPPSRSGVRQWQYRLLYERGSIYLLEATPQCLSQAPPSARRMGRFALELGIGPELIDRVRFDFPLLAAEPAPEAASPRQRPPLLGPGARSSTEVRIPGSERAVWARLLDRATRRVYALPWPPAELNSAEACPGEVRQGRP